MPIDPSIPLAIRPPAPGPSVLESYSQILQLQGQRAQAQERTASAADAQAKRARDAQIEQALAAGISVDPVTKQPTFDYEKALGRQLPPAVLFEVKKVFDENAERMARLQTANFTAAEKRAAYLAGTARSLTAQQFDPDLGRLEIGAAKQIGALPAALADQLLDAIDRDGSVALQQFAAGALARAGGAAPKLAQIQTMEGGVAGTRFVPEEAGTFYPSVPKASDTAAVGSFEDYVVRRFGPTPTAEQITQARKDYQQADDRPITINTGQRPITQTAEAGLISRLNSQWSKATAPKRELEAQLSTMRAGITALDRGDIPQATEAVLQPFLKILDPNSVVREGEFWRLREGLSLLTRAQTAFQRLTKGGFVPPAELKKYAQLAEEIASRYDSYVRGERARIGRVAERYSIPQELVFEGAAPLPDDTSRGTPPPPAGGLTYQDYLRGRK